MRVVEIEREEQLRPLRDTWNALLRECPSNTVFLTWEWAAAWLQAYGSPGDLRILAAFDEGNVLRGLVPLRSRRAKRYGQTVPVLSLVGDGSNDSDYLDFIIAAGYEERVIGAFGRHYAGQMREGTVLLLNEVPARSANLPLLRTWADANGWIWTEADVNCSTAVLPETWDAYLAALRPRFRTKIRSVLRNLESRGEVRFGFCEDEQQVERMLPILFDLHTQRWQEEGQPGVFGWDQKRKFYYALSKLMLDRGWLRFSWMEWNGVVLACQYGFAYRGTYFHLQEGYNPACDHWNVGIGLRAWSIREFLKQGIREYDFLGGTGRHKSDWGSEIKAGKNIQIARPTYRNLLFCHGPEWETRAREQVAQIVPEKVLAIRRAHLEKRAMAAVANGTHEHASSSSWLHEVAANCYLRAGIPSVLRPFRERYQLTRSPRLSCMRRSKAAGRILYYHRVNDERDPFFPSTSTDLFERQMRYVARHYDVVPLSELIDRLEAGRAENVVAITFDDGYGDNYDHALPVLRRCGLPATVFLATAGIDSREPLWFERLAEAIKTTGREFVDVEIDIPRRFWMRSEAERLESNEQMYGVLRRLKDTDRRRWVDRILGELNPPPTQRMDKMLTWDQVRQMKTFNIDFGGHSVTHPFLSKLTREQAIWEVSECKRRIEEEVQAPVVHFAYPSGREEDVADWNRDVLINAGYRTAATTTWGLNFASTDLMQLRRGQPWEENEALFAYKLDFYQLLNE